MTWGDTVYSGFNNEESDNTVYTNCIAGMSVGVTDLTPLWSGIYPYVNADTLRNMHGFVLNGGFGKHTLVNCSAIGNKGNGVQITNVNEVNIIGGSYINNTGYGVYQYYGGTGDTAFVLTINGARIKNNQLETHQVGTMYNQYIDDQFDGRMFYIISQTFKPMIIKSPTVRIEADSIQISSKFYADRYIPYQYGGAIRSTLFRINTANDGWDFISDRADAGYFSKDGTFTDQMTLGYRKITFTGSSGADSIIAYNIPLHLVLNAGNISGVTSLSSVGATLTGLTGILKGNGASPLTAITTTTSADYIGGDGATHTLNQAAITGLSTSDTPTFEGVIVGASATATAGSIKYTGGHFYGYNGSTWLQLDNAP
jgi:hypothetical protein